MTTMDVEVLDGVYSSDAVEWQGMIDFHGAVTAAGIPVKPPSGWFTDPGLGSATPLQISADGRVFGHIATWDATHIGMAGKVSPPKSRSDYAFFATGVVECEDGSMINTGQITLSGGHASLDASVAEAVAHYDNTSSAVMDVTAGEDRHGIWVAGALRPDVDDIKLRAIRAASVSGDWRPINGNLELVAVCAVNVPGFPIPRAKVASGQPVALVAAGTETLVRIAMAHNVHTDMNEALNESLASLDRRLHAIEHEQLSSAVAASGNTAVDVVKMSTGAATLRSRVASAVDDARRQIDLDVLRSRIHSAEDVVIASTVVDTTPPPPPSPDLAALRDRVRPVPEIWTEDEMPIDASLVACAQIELRARVKGLTATATSAWDADARKKAAKSGVALPDGSFPIRDKRDWDKARRALGRAKNKDRVIRHIKKRGRALGIAKEKIDAVGAAAASAAPVSVGDTQPD